MDKALSPTQTTSAERAGEWPLAVESGDAARVQSLLASGAGVDETLDRGETALMRASARGYADVARVLLEAGANVNARRGDGFTPLILAVFFGREDVVRLLLEAGADTSARTALGTTAARWAASRGFTEIVELLGEAEASRPAPPQEPDGRKPAGTEPGGQTHAEAEELRPAVTSSFKLQELPFEPPDSTVRREDPKRRTREHQDLKTRMEAIVAASSVGAAREPAAATADVREGDPFINAEAVGSPRAGEVTAPTPFATDESASETTRQDSPASSGPRFRGVLQSWPVTAGAVVLIVASVASVFLLRGSSETSNTRPATTAGEAPQPAVPQTPTQAAETMPQPSPSVTPEVVQPLPVAPGTYDSFPFTAGPQEVTTPPGPPPTAGAAPASNVPTVVSESGEGRASEGDATRGRAASEGPRGAASPPPAAATRGAREGEGVDEGAARETPPRNSPPRTGVETRRTMAGAPPPSSGNTPPPAPTPAERRKVIPWP